MSTLRTNALEGMDAKNSITIVAGLGNVTTANVQQGLLMGWLHGGSDASLQDSLNISSGNDDGTGEYTYTYTNNMTSTALYSATTGTQTSGNNLSNPRNITSSTVVVHVHVADSGSANDNNHFAQVAGDLA
jgi:hypothetical protein